MKKIIFRVLPVLVVVIAAILWLRGDREEEQAMGPMRAAQPPVAVEIAAVEKGTIVEHRILTGSLRAASRFDLSTQVAGRLERLEVDLGDRVERGRVVARLDGDKYRLEMEQARAELEVARANLVEAGSSLETRRREYERVTRLREQKVASESELDAALAEYRAQQARVRVTEAQVTQREAALMGAELMLSYTVIRAEWHGDDRYRVVAERFVEQGAYLPANTPLLSIVRLDRLTAVTHATEHDYPRFYDGQEVEVTADAVSGQRFSGRLARLAPVVRETSRQARLEIDVDNPERILKPGMFVRLKIELDRNDEAVIIPRAALVERPDSLFVYRADLENNTARRVEVKTGLQTREQVEIKEPLLEGHVITLGQHLLSDGSPIRIPAAEKEGRAAQPSGESL